MIKDYLKMKIKNLMLRKNISAKILYQLINKKLSFKPILCTPAVKSIFK